MTESALVKKRGRPAKMPQQHPDTRKALIRCGTAILTEQGFTASGLDGILKRVGVPKGSFYYYFANKEAFVREIIDYYGCYFVRKLDKFLLDETRLPLTRIQAFIDDAARGMAKYDFKRGCLVGNLGQEIGILPESYRQQLSAILLDWQRRLAQCLQLARSAGQLGPQADCDALAEYFWLGWEGAVMRARLANSARPLACFADGFFAGLPR